jgi:formylglycine-generating enzyme required for sulfatase activity
MGWYCGNSERKSEGKARRHMTVSSGFRTTPAKSVSMPGPVAQKQPNGWGFFDMHGNVAEWCEDGYVAYPSGSVNDPAGSAAAAAKVYRGGGWDSAASLCRAATRNASAASDRRNDRGFRLARIP